MDAGEGGERLLILVLSQLTMCPLCKIEQSTRAFLGEGGDWFSWRQKFIVCCLFFWVSISVLYRYDIIVYRRLDCKRKISRL